MGFLNLAFSQQPRHDVTSGYDIILGGNILSFAPSCAIFNYATGTVFAEHRSIIEQQTLKTAALRAETHRGQQPLSAAHCNLIFLI